MRYQGIDCGKPVGPEAARPLMDLKGLRRGIWWGAAIVTLCLVGGARAQESLDRGKSATQLFASDCSACHKSPQALAKAGGLFGLDTFLRTHYTASRESATAIANYLKSLDTGPASPARSSRRSAKGDGTAQPGDRKKPGAKPGEAKGASKSSQSKPPEARPSDILAPEPKSTESKPAVPSAGEAKPAEGAKPEKSD
jgi:hypothetical protein